MEENELFDDYLQNRLPDTERQVFERRLELDGSLRERFEFYRTVQADMEQWHTTAGGREQLIATLQSQKNSANSRQPGKVKSLRRYLIPLSAAAALMVTLMLWKFMGGSRSSAGDLFAQFTAGEGLSGQRGGADDAHITKAADYMADKQYAEAAAELKVFEGRLNEEPYLYLAFCQMQAGMYPQAEKHLNAIISTGNVYAVKARWFRALLLYKSGQTEACKKELEFMAGSADYAVYNKQARQLLQALP